MNGQFFQFFFSSFPLLSCYSLSKCERDIPLVMNKGKKEGKMSWEIIRAQSISLASIDYRHMMDIYDKDMN